MSKNAEEAFKGTIAHTMSTGNSDHATAGSGTTGLSTRRVLAPSECDKMICSLPSAHQTDIARHVIRIADRLGTHTAVVYCDADANAPHVWEADRAVRIGPESAQESRLVGETVLKTACECGGDTDACRGEADISLLARQTALSRGLAASCGNSD